MKTRAKSTIIFIICLIVIGILAYASAIGITAGGYRFKPISETINRGLDLQGEIGRASCRERV